ncbi:MAG: Fic family protein [Halomonas sp.]|nr:Fic family protein [Halomonas sp.]
MTYSMEPMLPTDKNEQLADTVIELTSCTSALAGKIQKGVQDGISDLVRSMNCYYSNLIEGHNTHPRDIERALHDNYSRDAQKRTFQEEARAHIELQKLIEQKEAPDVDPTSGEYIRWLHREFCSRLPEDLLWAENPDTKENIAVIPGEYRTTHVQVGRHIPPEHERIEAYMKRFHDKYSHENLSRSQYPIAVAAAHHRLLWIHPFIDGNGRVTRLLSHAMLLKCGIGSGLWSISRGLARNSDAYKAALAKADSPRQGDLDGRGALSAQGLFEFTLFFLETCIDQVKFMESLLQPSELLRRITLYTTDEIDANRLPKGSLELLREAFLAGEVARGAAPRLTGYQERQARQVLSKLIEKGLLVSQGPRAPVRLGFPLDVVERWLPNLYPVN